MARYRIVKKQRLYKSCWAKKDDPKKELTTYRIQVRRMFRWKEFTEKLHPLFHSFGTLEEAKERLQDFVDAEKKRKEQIKNPEVVYYLNEGLL